MDIIVNETIPTNDPHRTTLPVVDHQPAILNNLPDADELLTPETFPRQAYVISIPDLANLLEIS
jgi:hypothetical protein